MVKIFGVLIILVACALAAYSFTDFVWTVSSPAERLAKLVEEDISSLQTQGKLSKEWSDIKDVNLIATSAKTEDWLKSKQPKFTTHPDGKYKLEVVLIDWEEGSAFGGIVQLSLFDIASGNKIGEIGRTYGISNGKMPEVEPLVEKAEEKVEKVEQKIEEKTSNK